MNPPPPAVDPRDRRDEPCGADMAPESELPRPFPGDHDKPAVGGLVAQRPPRPRVDDAKRHQPEVMKLIKAGAGSRETRAQTTNLAGGRPVRSGVARQ